MAVCKLVQCENEIPGAGDWRKRGHRERRPLEPTAWGDTVLF